MLEPNATDDDSSANAAAQVVGRMFWENTFAGIDRFGAFHEHIGCTPCDAFFESEVRRGPWTGPADALPRQVRSIGFKPPTAASCQLFDVEVANATGGAMPQATIKTGPATGPRR